MSAKSTPETVKISCPTCHVCLTVKKADENATIKCPNCRKEIGGAATARSGPSAKKKSPTKAKPAESGAEVGEANEGVSGLVKWGGGGVAAVLLILGCYYLYTWLFAGPAVGTLNGKVYLADALLASGTVALYPKSGDSISCTIRADGTYEAKGVERGELIITVVQLNPKFKDGATRRKEAKGKIENLPEDGEKQHLLPEIYAHSTSSPLRFTLQKSSDAYDIYLSKELNDAPPGPAPP